MDSAYSSYPSAGRSAARSRVLPRIINSPPRLPIALRGVLPSISQRGVGMLGREPDTHCYSDEGDWEEVEPCVHDGSRRCNLEARHSDRELSAIRWLCVLRAFAVEL